MTIERMKEHIKLSYDQIIALLQGKRVSFILVWSGKKPIELVIDGPANGMFLTNEEIHQIQNEAQMSILSILDQINEDREP